MSIKVSILTPTYNHEKYIEACIKSVLSQSYEDWEMIIVDDASTDNTVKIVEKYEKEDSRIKLIVHEENYGPYRLKDTYNEAFNKSKGEYIAILEGDDYWPSYKLEFQLSKFEKSDAVLSYGNCKVIDSRDNIIDEHKIDIKNKKLFNDPVGSILEYFAKLQCPPPAVTVMIKRNVLKDIGGFKGDGSLPLVDYPTYLEIALRGKFLPINRNLGFWRRHSLSITLSSVEKTIETLKNFSEYFINFLEKNKDKDYIKNNEHLLGIISKHDLFINRGYYYNAQTFLKLKNYEMSRKLFLKAFRSNVGTEYKLASLFGMISTYIKIDLINLFKILRGDKR